MNKSIYRTQNENYINPLLWVHGEEEHVTRNHIAEMNRNGIGSFVVEPRPHSGYLKDQWWNDLDIIIDEAQKRDMKVWLFDDGDYPSGCANGEIIKKHPEYRKKFMKAEHIDALGPMKGSSFLINQWLEDDESVIALVVGKRGDEPDEILGETLVDISGNLKNGVLYWDIPEGKWRVFIIIRSLKCLEKHTENHINVLEKDAVKAFVDMTYEPTYKHLKEHFGKTIAGFFTDEPRFGNYPSYGAKLGDQEMPLPYSDQLINLLSEELGRDYIKYLPLLWYQSDQLASEVRFTYMNLVSNIFCDNYSEYIGNWCRDRGVKLIGHVIEENGAHARVGYGSGHFFRAMKGLDCGGLDIVYNLMPGYTSGTYDTPFFRVDVDFNHWGIAKMASSSSHIDPKKNGITICETFGAYGWQEGLKLVKWITDHLCVRGVNVIVPHAFTLREFPDADCPPHFYGGGQNPQWKDFDLWAGYANRVCHLITGGVHKATAAVLYHAEAEWAGDYEPFERTVKSLALSHVDCDVVPIDSLMDERITCIKNKCLNIHQETYEVLIIPYAEILPQYFEKKIVEFINVGLPVVFIKDSTKRGYINDSFEDNELNIYGYDHIGEWIKEKHFSDILVKGECNDLRHYHYIKNDQNIYFLVNESKNTPIDAMIDFKEQGTPIVYDALTDSQYSADIIDESVSIRLEPYQSIFIIFGENKVSHLMPRQTINHYSKYLQINDNWDISVATISNYPSFQKVEINQLINIAEADLLPDFSGIIRYKTIFEVDHHQEEDMILDLGAVYETANVWLNERKLGRLICPPYHLIILKGWIKEEANELVIEVTNTLAKQLHNNGFDKYMPQEPSGLLGPVSLNIKNK